MEANLLIEASAGTGKTQALAERLIELLRLGVKPQEIVALTFSRAAAGEIFERFVSLLADRAAEDPSCVALLREVIATQHLSQIGTLDSFLMRIVRSFPLELGLCGDLEMMDEYRAGVELSRTSFSILRRTDRATKKAFVEAFSLAMNHENVRSFAKSYRTFIAAWHEHVLAHPSADAWGVPETIWHDPPAEASATEEDVKAAAARVRIDWKDLGLDPDACRFTRVDAEGRRTPFAREALDGPLAFAPGACWGVEVEPLPAPAPQSFRRVDAKR